ncbi:MAG: PD-(D/E)XK nuclease family protein [Clostridia bacterium]|nr:PD-(D/E)XK nuclease family protein [Clostridia bacterium]
MRKIQYIFSENSKIVHASVRALCDFIFRTGDVYSGGSDITGNAMLMGAKIHRELQSRYKKENKNYQSEYHIKYFEEFEDFDYEIAGSIDGILENGDATVIDEFKTTSLELENLEWDTVRAYSAQLMCYGFMYCAENATNFITLRLTFYNYDDDDIKTIEKEFTFTQLRLWFDELLRAHVKWAKLVYDHKMRRNASLREMRFPFSEYRSGQRELSAKIYRCIRDGKRLFAEAPTGIGKTVSTLFPSLKALGEGEGDKIFYLSAKNSGFATAEDCLGIFCEKGAQIKYCSLTSKEKICLRDKNCLPSVCEYSKGHYDRVNDAIFDLVSNHNVINKELIMEYSEKYKVCPFEFQLDVSMFCDCVIGDYNYAFDPRAKLQRYFSDGGDYIILVDEAHNLVDRAREMFSAGISMLFLRKFSKHFKGIRKLQGRLTKCVNVLKKYRQSLEISEKAQKKVIIAENDVEPFRSFCDAYRKFLTEDGYDEVKKNTLELFFEISFFVEIFDIESVFQEDYIDFCETDGDDTTLYLYCADPSNQIKLACSKMRSSTFFSATMTPSEYYIKMLGADMDEDETISIPSPFPKENMLLCICKNVSTRFKDRNDSIEDVIQIIYEACSKKVGNYFVFFPSYGYMKDVYDEFCVSFPDIETICQQPRMTKEERDEYLSRFKRNPTETLVGFALCGGIFSEGVDLTGDRLSGAIIVGTGLPVVCFERDMLKDHFDKTIGEGFGYNYAYTYTGLNRVYQAGGRVIRTKDDKGFVILVDDRYSKISHRRTFPSAWKNNIKTLLTTEAVGEAVGNFWEKQI